MNELEPNFNERPKVEPEDSPVVYRAKMADAEFVVSTCFANNIGVSSLQSVILHI
jgi:hypothetical protein